MVPRHPPRARSRGRAWASFIPNCHSCFEPERNFPRAPATLGQAMPGAPRSAPPNNRAPRDNRIEARARCWGCGRCANPVREAWRSPRGLKCSSEEQGPGAGTSLPAADRLSRHPAVLGQESGSAGGLGQLSKQAASKTGDISAQRGEIMSSVLIRATSRHPARFPSRGWLLGHPCLQPPRPRSDKSSPPVSACDSNKQHAHTHTRPEISHKEGKKKKI